MNEHDRTEMIEVICDIFNYMPEELELWNDTNIYNAYLSAQKAINDCED